MFKRPVRAVAAPALLILLLLLLPGLARGQDASSLALVDETETLGPGITLRHLQSLDATGWYDDQILTVDLSEPAVTTDLLMGESVTSAGPISAKANRVGAVAGTNGDFFDINNSNAPLGAEVLGGELIKSPHVGGWQHAGVTREGIGALVDATLEATATVDGTPRTVLSLNAANGSTPADALLAYTTAWGTYSRARGVQGATDVAEVLVRNDQVVSVTPDAVGAGPIPEDGFVLVGRGAEAAALEALEPGDPVTLTYGLRDELARQMRFVVGGNQVLVRDGQRVPDEQLDPTLAPRTAIGFKDGGRTLILFTTDGRRSFVPGMSLRRLAREMEELGAEDALNLDGGGSTTMVARALGDPGVTVRNTPSDGRERNDPNGVGVFVAPGSGRAEELVVRPGGDDARIFPGLHRTLSAAAVDDHRTPVPVARGDVRWSTDAGSVAGGLLRAPADATGALRVRAATDTAAGDARVRVLGALDELELSTPRLSLADVGAAQAVTVTGRDAEGFAAPVEPADLELEYDESLLRVAPDGTGLRLTALRPGGTVMTLSAGGRSVRLPISVGVETLTPYAFDDEGANTRWTATGTAGRTKTLSNTDEGLRMDYQAQRNMGFTAASRPERWVELPGQPLRMRVRIRSSQPTSLSYVGLWDGDGTSVGLYGSPLAATTDWQEITFTIPADVTFPLRLNSFQLIETTAARQADGWFVVGGIEVDDPSPVDIPAQEPLRPDPLISADGRVPAGAWEFATLSDVQFTAANPELSGVGIAALERIRRTDAELVVLNGDITDLGAPEDMALARDVLEEGGCDLVPAGGSEDADPATIPCYYVPGNHESYRAGGQGDLAPFVAEFGAPYRAFDHRGTRFVLLNSALGSFRASGFDQLPMLREALASAEGDPAVGNVVVFAHHAVDDPDAAKASQLGDRLEVALVKRLLTDFREASGKGAAMMGSHAQIVDVRREEGVPYVVLPSSGKAPYGTPDRGGFTGYVRWAVDGGEDAAGQWLTGDVRAFAQSATLDAPATLEVSRGVELSGSLVQPSGLLPGSRVVPLRYPMSVRWGGSDGLAIGAGPEAAAAARAAGKVAILDPGTRILTGLRRGTVTVRVTSESMRAFTGPESLGPVVVEREVEVVPYAGPGPRLTPSTPVFAGQAAGTVSAGQWVTVANTGDAPLELRGGAVVRGGDGQFLVAADECAGATLAPGATCRVLLRFAPAAAGTTVTAELVLAANTADATHAVPLSGTGVALPAGEPGPEGPAGPPGSSGPQRPAGRRRPAGDRRVPRVRIACELVRGRSAIRCDVRDAGGNDRRVRATVRAAGESRTRSGEGRVRVTVRAERRLRRATKVRVHVRTGGARRTLRLRAGAPPRTAKLQTRSS